MQRFLGLNLYEINITMMVLSQTRAMLDPSGGDLKLLDTYKAMARCNLGSGNTTYFLGRRMFI
jgi:hypothetical protein